MRLVRKQQSHGCIKPGSSAAPISAPGELFSCRFSAFSLYLWGVTSAGIQAACSTLLLVCGGAAHGQSGIEGRVSLPKPEPLDVPPPRYAGQVGEIAPPDPPVAVVYLAGEFPKATTDSTQLTNEVLQLGMQFRPALLPIQVGSSVKFPNGDDFYHNVFSYSKTKRFDLGRYRKSDRPPVEVFDKPGVVKLYCEIHQHMRGVILVLDTPYFTRTQTNGVYRLEHLPAGQYQLKAWVDEKHVYEKAVNLEPGQQLHVDFDTK
jgi:plastocyanin